MLPPRPPPGGSQCACAVHPAHLLFLLSLERRALFVLREEFLNRRKRPAAGSLLPPAFRPAESPPSPLSWANTAREPSAELFAEPSRRKFNMKAASSSLREVFLCAGTETRSSTLYVLQLPKYFSERKYVATPSTAHQVGTALKPPLFSPRATQYVETNTATTQLRRARGGNEL